MKTEPSTDTHPGGAPDRFIIVGAGAVGSQIGGAIGGGAEVVFADPCAQVRAAWIERGFRAIDCPRGLARFAFEERDIVVVATRAPDVRSAIEPAPLGVPIVCVSNGLHEEAESDRPASICFGCVDFAARCVAPGRSEPLRAGAITLPRRSPSAAAQRLATALGGGRFACRLVDDIEAHIWSKMIFNAAFEPLAALIGGTYGAVFAARGAAAALGRLLSEGVRVARAAGLSLGRVQSASPAMLAGVLRTPIVSRLAAIVAARQARHVESVMARDAGRRASTEIDHINGAIVRTGERAGVDAPTHRTVIRMIHEMEHGGRRAHPENVRLALSA